MNMACRCWSTESLAQALYKTVKIDQTIPLGLYLVIAELMAHVYRLRGSAQADVHGQQGRLARNLAVRRQPGWALRRGDAVLRNRG